MEWYDILIVGGGAAGIAAAKAARGVKVLLAERRAALGGVLLQCAHRGFGAGKTGPEYAAQLLRDFPQDVRVALHTTVLSLGADRSAVLSGREEGRRRVAFSRLILAAGCREIPMGALPIAGTRPKGVYTAGQMQERMNLYGHVPEGPAVILGSGDLGLIMAKQLAQVGLSVVLVEKRASCGGMARNRRALEGHDVSLRCGVTIRKVHGEGQLEGCTLDDGAYLPCKTLLIAVGLRPERELAQGLGAPDWLYFCGNCRSVHPMVDSVVLEGMRTGAAAKEQTRYML